MSWDILLQSLSQFQVSGIVSSWLNEKAIKTFTALKNSSFDIQDNFEEIPSFEIEEYLMNSRAFIQASLVPPSKKLFFWV